MAKPEPRLAREPGPHCGSCTFFNTNLTCDLVAGEISPRTVCDLWTADAVSVATTR
jgi:hypothetical protein